MLELTDRRGLAAGVLVALTSLTMAHAADVAIVGTVLSDNGDQDGYADTQETVTLRLVLRNLSADDHTGLVARATTEDAGLVCLTSAEIFVGDLAAGTERTTDDGFVFVVAHDVERGAIDQALTVTITVHLRSDAGQRVDRSRPIELDLDLDPAGGGGPTTFFESFESGFGAFTTMHIDQTLNPPDSDITNKPAGELNADGHRCQYTDPDWLYGYGGQCFPNTNNVADAFHFRIVADRAFSGAQAMAFTEFLDEFRGYTTPASQLEAIRTSDPVHLAWQGACSVTGGACTDDVQCPAGEACAVPQPKLSFKHQASLVDHRSISNSKAGVTADRGVIGVQLADDTGAPLGPWIKAYPFVNVYDSQASSNFFHCSFDPIDDGNTEEDFFDPTDPYRQHGPSSTCAPELAFAHQGDTDDPFDAGNVGAGLPGSGLQGELGSGTWVEPVVDLSRFRGRRLRVRFLTSQLKLGGAGTWEQFLNDNPDPGDDGWFLDDVRVTHALTEAATVTVDSKDNSHLEVVVGDEDDDGVFDACDNCLGLADGGQADADVDGLGDACDPCPEDPDDDIDGDGLCADADNCPFDSNASQADADGDGLGDACDACPLVFSGDDLDTDGDGVTCDVDVCPDVADADQLDDDGDGLGNACDACPGDPANDPDGDSVCNGVDSCPLLENPDQDGTIRLARRTGQARLSPDRTRLLVLPGPDFFLHTMAATGGPLVTLSRPEHGEVWDFVWTPDGTAAIYFDDVALRRVPAGGGAVQTLAVPGGRIAESRLTPDADRAVVAYWPDATGTLAVFSVPTVGGPIAPLGPPAVPGSRTTNVRFGPGGANVLMDHSPVLGSAPTELHCAAIDGTSTARITSPLASSAAVGPAVFDPSGTRVVYVAEQETAGVVELYSAPCDGSAAPVKLNTSLPEGGRVGSAFALSGDGSTVVYTADQDTAGVVELYSVPLDGSATPVKLNGALPEGGDVESSFAITPDQTSVIYVAEQEQNGRYDLYRVPLLGGASVRFEFPSNGFTPLPAVFRFALGGSALLVALDTLGPAGSRLFLAPLDGTPPTPLHTTDSDEDIDGGFWSDDSRVVLRETPSGEIWSVPLSGEAGVPLSGESASVAGHPLRVGGQHLLYAGQPASVSGDSFSLYTVPVSGGDPLWLANEVERVVGWDGSIAYWIDFDLFASWRESDADGDGLHAACDCDGSGGGSRVFEEVNDGMDNQCPGDPGFGLVDELSRPVLFEGDHALPRIVWSPQAGASAHELIRSADGGFESGCACERIPSSVSGRDVPEVPGEGQVLYYLVRPGAPFQGSAGASSDGTERTGACLDMACVPGSL